MNIVICGKSKRKLKFACTLLHSNGLYFKNLKAFETWIKCNPTTVATVLLQVDDTILKLLRRNRHLCYILVMECLPCDDLMRHIDWVYCFTNNKKTKLLKNVFNLSTSVYDYWNNY
jgi:hypothetical protein